MLKIGKEMTQADITAACVTTFLADALTLDVSVYPALGALTQRCEQLPVFKDTRLAFYVPKG